MVCRWFYISSAIVLVMIVGGALIWPHTLWALVIVGRSFCSDSMIPSSANIPFSGIFR